MAVDRHPATVIPQLARLAGDGHREVLQVVELRPVTLGFPPRALLAQLHRRLRQRRLPRLSLPLIPTRAADLAVLDMHQRLKRPRALVAHARPVGRDAHRIDAPEIPRVRRPTQLHLGVEVRLPRALRTIHEREHG